MKQLSLFATEAAAAPAMPWGVERFLRPGWNGFDDIESNCEEILRQIEFEGVGPRSLLGWVASECRDLERFCEDLEDWLAGRPEKRRSLSILNGRCSDEEMGEAERLLPLSPGDED